MKLLLHFILKLLVAWENKRRKIVFYFIVLLMTVFSLNTSAQSLMTTDIDSMARASRQNSIMFQSIEDQTRRAYEEEQERQRQAYEEEMRRQEEEMRKAEEERKKALKPVNLFGNTFKIYAEVNGEVITSRDMQQRTNVFVATTQIPVTSKNRDIVIERVLEGAIDEKIKLQEAAQKGIKITAQDLENGFKAFVHGNGATPEEFHAMLKETEVDEDVFFTQMKAEMAWSRLVQMKASQEVRVSKNDIQRAIQNITRDKERQKFMISEIVIPKKNTEHIGELVQALKSDPRFELYAMQFSSSPTAKNGGNLGWVSSEQLSEKMLKTLKTMKKGDISEPILIGMDYHIIKLQQKYTPGTDKMPVPSEDEIRQMLENKKVEEVANKYLRDLRNKAIINRKS